VEARRRGISPQTAVEFAAQLAVSTRRRAVVIDRNRDQLWSMSRELEADYGFATECIDLAEGSFEESVARVQAAVQHAQIVVTTAFERRAVKRSLGGFRIPVCAVTMCSELFAEVRRLLPTRAVYFVVCDPRFAAKLHNLFASAPGDANLHVLIHDRDDLDIPATAPVYVTRLARLRLQQANGHGPLLARGMPEARVFSEDTARDLIRFLITSPGGR
jgi:hypothetical protein